MNELFLKIINMSISASWLILAVLILRLVLKKAPKWVNVLLWGIVAIRLICPITIESPISLIPNTIGNGELVSNWMDDYIDDIDIHHPDSVYYDAAIGAGREPISDGEGGYYVVTKHDQLGEPATIENTVMPVLSVVWASGMVVFALYTFISYFRLRRKLDTAVLCRDNIYQSENVSSPFVLGIIKPKIYLPFKMDSQDLEHVVAHEQAHIRRKDHWWKPLGFLLLTIHWFNPLMWLAYVLLCRDIELACDEKVIKELGNEQRADYTQALVACSVNRRMIAACPLAFGEVGVKERVKSVMNYKKPAFWVIILAVIACVGVAVCFLTNPAGTALTKWKIDEIDMNATLGDIHSMTVRYYGDSVSCNDSDSNRFIATMGKIRVGRNSISQSRDHNRDHSFTITINDNLHLHFSFDFSEIWVDNGVKPSFSYPITNPETARELMLDFSFTNRGITEQWFDYLDNPEEMQWDGRMEANIPEFPDVTFRWYPEKMEAVTEDGITPLYTGMPIWNAYFCDLTGDSLPELCSTISWGSGMIDNRVTIYDYANGASYELSDRGNYDFILRLNEADGYLYVDKTKYNTDELVESGRLVFKNDCIQVEGFSYNTDEPAKYYLTIGAEGVKSIELTMPNSSGGCENVDGSLFKKGERIWLENLDGYSDLRGLTITALGENGEVIWNASVPDGEENKGFTHLVNDDWEITNIE